MAKTERGQIANQILPFLGDTTFLLAPPAVKSGAKQWFYGGPGISVVGDSDIEDAEVGIFVDGHDFGDTQGTGKVELGDSPVYASANKVLQTVTAWSDWRITITVALGAQSPGVKYFFVTDGQGAVSEPKTCWVHRATAIKLQPSTNITTGAVDATTNRLTAPTGTFLAGNRTDDTNPTPTLSLGAGQFTEEEMSFIVTSGAIGGQSYVFRLVERLDDGTLISLDNYAVSPQITIGSAPVQGTARFGVPLVQRTTVAKIATSSLRAIVPTTETVTERKIGLTSVNASIPVTSTITNRKIALGSLRTIQPTTALISGSAVNNTAQTSLRGLVNVIARITGTKIASSSVTAGVPVVKRVTTSKIGLSSIRVSVPVVQRTTLTKIGLTSLNASVDVISRISGFKSLAQGSFRAIVPTSLNVSASKIALGRAATGSVTAVGIFTATSSNAVQAASKFLVTVGFRATGTKIANASIRASVPTVIRVTAFKIASSSVFFSAPTVVRTTSKKIAVSSVSFLANVNALSTGKKTATGSVRIIQSTGLNTVAKKISSTSVRGLVQTIFRPVINTATQRIAAFTITAYTSRRNISLRATANRINLIKNRNANVTIMNDRVTTINNPQSLEID